MKNFLILFFLCYSYQLIGQGKVEKINKVRLEDYAFLEEGAAIAKFDMDFAGKSVDTVVDLYRFFASKKYAFIKNLLVKHKVNPIGFFDAINSAESVCGVGLKRIKDVSPACKTPKQYEENSNSTSKIEVAQILIKSGVIPSVPDIGSCIYRNEYGLFQILLKAKGIAIPEKEVAEEWLVSAIDVGHIDFVNYLLANNVSPNAVNDNNFYAIYRAVVYPEIFFTLVEKGADYKVVGYQRTTPIIHAAREGCIEVIKFLLDKGVSPTEMHGNWSAIDMAKKHNQKNSREVLSLLKSYPKK